VIREPQATPMLRKAFTVNVPSHAFHCGNRAVFTTPRLLRDSHPTVGYFPAMPRLLTFLLSNSSAKR